ncbi:MAG: hypothetical protein PHU93_00140 [Candidatus Gracilibacteria bacterium]|nr:hypothetical protein [Candidatus Gracilibacteria bacterium]
MDKDSLILQILDIFIKLNHIAGFTTVQRSDLTEMENGLMLLEANELQALFSSVTQNAITALQQVDADIQAIAKEGIRRLESMDRDADLVESANMLQF